MKMLCCILLYCWLCLAAIDGQPADRDTGDFKKHKSGLERIYIDSSHQSTDGQKQDYRRKRSRAFYDSLHSFAQKHKISQRLYRYLFNTPSKDTDTTQKDVDPLRNETAYIPYIGQYIRNISIKQLEVFGPSIQDTSKTPDSWIGKAANTIHQSTRKSIIKKNLYIHQGDTVDPYSLANNERLIRQLSNIEDARIQIYPAKEAPDSVDMVILVKDVWPVGVNADVRDIDKADLELWHTNVGGWGHELYNEVPYSGENEPYFGYIGDYHINNLGGSFIDTRLHYRDEFGQKTMRWQIKRNFYAHQIKYAGGLDYGHYRQKVTPNYDIGYEYDRYNIWMGRSWIIPSSRMQPKNRIMGSARIFKYDFQTRPPVTSNTKYRFHNRTFYLANLGWAAQWHYKSRLIYNYGRTEDIPCGHLFELTGGYEINEFKNRWYTASGFSKGGYITSLGYFRGDVAIGGFWNNQLFEQGLLKLKTRFFSHPLILNRFKFRFFFNSYYIKGIKRYADESIQLGNDPGIKGISGIRITGNEKWINHTEIVCFTPLYIYGFRFVLFGASNMGMIARKGENLLNNRIYSSIDAGIRVRNKNLAFKTFQLKVSYYPHIPEGGNVQFIEFSGIKQLQLKPFRISLPDILSF